MKPAYIILAAALLATTSADVAAAVVASANFNTSSTSTGQASVVPDPSNVFTWTRVNTGGTLGVTADPTFGTNALLVSPSSSIAFGVLGQFNAQTLTSAGDKLSVSFTGHYTAPPPNGSTTFRFGFASSANRDNAFGAFLGTGTSTSFGLYTDVPGDNLPLSGGALLLGSAGNHSGISGTGSFGGLLTITKTADGYDLTANVNGLSLSQSTTSGWDFYDTIVFRNNNTTTGFVIDDVEVAFAAVPEPASCGLIGMTAIGGLAFTRRRRRVAE